MYIYGDCVSWSLSGTPTKSLRISASMACTFAEAVEAFLDPHGFALRDEKHSNTESRHYWVGKLPSGVVITVRYTRRAGKIRIFGCAKWRNFRRLYDERAKAKKS